MTVATLDIDAVITDFAAQVDTKPKMVFETPVNPAALYPSTARILYYCGKRKQYFKRNVKIDPTMEMHRKIAFAQFSLIYQVGRPADRPSLVLAKTTGFNGSSDKGSVPAYLFGPEYYRAHRINPDDLWDLRKEAFVVAK